MVLYSSWLLPSSFIKVTNQKYEEGDAKTKFFIIVVGYRINKIYKLRPWLGITK